MVILHLVHYLTRFGLLGVTSSMIIENLGIPFPTEGAFLVAQHLIDIGQYSFWYMYWLITAAHILGAVIAYGIGFWLREFTERVFGQGKGFKKARVKLLDWYGHYGSVIVFGARLVGYVRPWSSLIAGFAEFSFWPFLLWSSLGTLIFVYVTMKVTAVLVIAWQHFPFGHIIISVLIALGFFAFLFFARRKSKSEV